ncbi:MAG: class I SAM-dependent methyltransferase [Myxococcota bacterium]
MARALAKQRARAAAALQKMLERGTTDHYVDTALYDYEYAERTADVRWYRRIARNILDKGDRIAELGAGTGRITCPLARDGYHIDAVDLMPSMLEALDARRQKKAWRDRITLHEADMRDLPLDDGAVDLVISPFNALMHLYTWQDLKACFDEVYRVLKPGGTFAFDVQVPDMDWLLWDPDERHAVTRFVHPESGETLIYSTNHRYDPSTQICHICIYYDEAPPRGRRFVPPSKPKRLVRLAHRQFFPEELRALVSMSGLTLQSHEGDFDGSMLGNLSESQTVVCTKPG